MPQNGEYTVRTILCFLLRTQTMEFCGLNFWYQPMCKCWLLALGIIYIYTSVNNVYIYIRIYKCIYTIYRVYWKGANTWNNNLCRENKTDRPLKLPLSDMQMVVPFCVATQKSPSLVNHSQSAVVFPKKNPYIGHTSPGSCLANSSFCEQLRLDAFPYFVGSISLSSWNHMSDSIIKHISNNNPELIKHSLSPNY